MHKGKITLKIILLLIFTDILETLIQFCFKKSALTASTLQITHPADILIFAKTVIFSGFLWLGVLTVTVVFILWSTILSKIDLSVAVPVCSFSYILVPLVSIIFFNEKITLLRWLGIFLILTGVIFVSMSARKYEGVAK